VRAPELNGTSRADERAGWIESWVGLVRRRWPAGLIVGFVLFVLTAASVLFARPIYRAEARLRLGEPPPMSGVSPTASFFGLVRMGGDPFANDLEVLDSRTLAENVILDNSLNAKLQAPRGWHRDSIFTSFAADTTTRLAVFEFEWQTDGAIAIAMLSPRDSAMFTTRPGQRVTFEGVTAVFQAWREGMPRTVRMRTTPLSLAVLENQPRFVSERSRRDANVVDLSFDDSDPDLAPAVVHSVIRRFIQLRTTIQKRESGETVDSLRVVAEATARELREAEQAMEDWQRETRLVQPDVQGEAFVERYSGLAFQVEEARYELEAIVQIAQRMDASPDSVLDWVLLLTHPKFLENETIGTLLSQVAELQARRTELLARRAETSTEVTLVDQRMRETDAKLRSLVHGYRDALAQRLRILQEQTEHMDATLAATPAQAIELGRRQRAIRLLTEIILLTEQRLRQEEMRQALTFSNVQVIDPPALRWKPIWPRRTIGLAVGLLISGAFGLLALVVADRADRTVRRAVQIEEATGAPILAVTLDGHGRAPALSPREVSALMRRGTLNGDAARVSIAATSRDDRAEAVARALADGNGHVATVREDDAHFDHDVVAIPPVDDFAAAAAADSGPVALVIHYGRTRRDELERAVRLLRAAGATIVGAIVVVDRERQRRTIWT
jgi:uncharacterized protein involved in exopolysaccharide biosynthesis